MLTYAVLGGTGNTGGGLIELLAQSRDTVLHVYARSRSKLLKAHPILAEASSPHTVFAGDLADVDLFAQCLDGTTAAFGVVGTNANNPEIRLAQDLAKVLIAALSKLKSDSREDKIFKPPLVVFLTSAGMTSDRRVRANFPGYLHWMLQRVGKYIYLDFQRATALLQQPDNSWIPVIFFCAPGIMPGPSQGKIRIGFDIPKNAPLYASYADLARGMVQATVEEGKWVHKEIGIAGARMPSIKYGTMFFYFTTGLMCVWAPPLWRFGHQRGWWGDH
jgi:hypothetical protein